MTKRKSPTLRTWQRSRMIYKKSRYEPESGQGDPEAFRAFVRFMALILVGIFAAFVFATAAHCQPRFAFTATTAVDFTDREPITGHPSIEVWAASDSLYIGFGGAPKMWKCINWVEMDNGDLYYIGPYIQFHYSPGPGGQSILVRSKNLVVELYEAAKNVKQ